MTCNVDQQHHDWDYLFNDYGDLLNKERLMVLG